MGITFPNVLGQERVLRHAYKRANLDPVKTAYLECHGTGTPSGDPIEVRAVSAGMNDTRNSEKPLLLGAVKSNIGHSEAVSFPFFRSVSSIRHSNRSNMTKSAGIWYLRHHESCIEHRER